MLSSLRIRNLALVEDLTWELASGLVGVTGETGAGKSIIVGALKLILGQRADRSLIRTGEETCTVEASFQLRDTEAIDAILTEAGFDPCEDGELLIKRSISVGGANKQFVNCSPATAQLLKGIGEFLVDLHGPHDHQSLNSRERQLENLDKFAGLEKAAVDYVQAWHTWRASVDELEALEQSERAGSQQIDMLRFQIEEIAAAELKPDEEEEIENRHRIAANSTSLAEQGNLILSAMSEGPSSVLTGLREVHRAIQQLEKIDPASVTLFEEFESARIVLQEIESSVGDYLEEIEADPAELGLLEERMRLFKNLKRKYGATLQAVLDHKEEAESQLAKIENRGEEIDRLREQMEACGAKVLKLGKGLSKKRAAAAPKLAAEVASHLADLGFKRSVFEVVLSPLEQPSRHGLEEVDFQFAPNPGEPLKPLRLTASSGEMSRVLLAVKSALAKQDAVPLLVFDEIDANVGGNIAEAVGRKMGALGSTHQVIAITHFPQVASLSQSHFVVTKDVGKERTFSRIQRVSDEDRVEELARMLGGSAESARAHAQSLLAAGATAAK